MFLKSITKKEIQQLPIRSFEGSIFVVDNHEKLEKVIPIIKEQTILGFDTETKPAFRKGKINKVALLQLSNSSQAFLFRLNKIGLPDPLIEIFSSKKITKVGAAIKDDIRNLKKIKLFQPNQFIELQDVVKLFDIKNYSIRKISAIVLNMRISKGQQLSNWENEQLTIAQQRYAATDAWICYMVYNKLKALMEGKDEDCP